MSATAPLPVDQQQLVSPLRPLPLERELASHPDKGFVRQLLHNLTHGCCIGYGGPHFAHTARHLPSPPPHTPTSSLQHWPRNARQATWLAHTPLLLCQTLTAQVLASYPRKTAVVICDLSSPPGSSINDYIDPLRFSLRYCSIDSAIAILNTLGPGALMGKMNLKNAFRLLPVRYENWHLLAIQWQGHWYLDKCLPFGLCSSPALSTSLLRPLSGYFSTAMECTTSSTTWMTSSLQALHTPTPVHTTCPSWPTSALASMPLSSMRRRRALPPL